MITETDVEKLAELARIAITSEEKQRMVKDFEAILAYVGMITSVDTKGASNVAPYVKNQLRDDTNSHVSGEYTERLLAQAPEKKDSFVKVPKVL